MKLSNCLSTGDQLIFQLFTKSKNDVSNWARFFIVTGLNRAVPSRSFLPTG